MNRNRPPINGDVLYQARLRLGYTQFDVERLTSQLKGKVDNSNLSKLERGIARGLSPSGRRALAKALGFKKPEDMFVPCATCGQPWSRNCMTHDSPAQDRVENAAPEQSGAAA